jgi:uncharacterized membrane protein
MSLYCSDISDALKILSGNVSAGFYLDRVIKINTQVIFIIVTLLVFVFLGFMMSISIKKHEAKMANQKKKGRAKYLREVKQPKR